MIITFSYIHVIGDRVTKLAHISRYLHQLLLSWVQLARSCLDTLCLFLVSVILQKETIWGGGFIFTCGICSFPMCLLSTTVLLYFYGLSDTFWYTSTTVLLCLEARLQEKVEGRSPSPLPCGYPDWALQVSTSTSVHHTPSAFP